MILRDSPLHERVRVNMVDLPDPLRVAEMGIRPGAVVRVTQKSAFGGIVIAVGGARVAIDGGTSRRVTVSPLEAG